MKTARSKRPMTPKMLKLLQFIKNYNKQYKYSPTFLEMANELGYKSKNSVSSLIKKLEERNELKRDFAGYSRNITINDKSWENIFIWNRGSS